MDLFPQGAPTGAVNDPTNELEGADFDQERIDSFPRPNVHTMLDLAHPLDVTAAADKYARSQRSGERY